MKNNTPRFLIKNALMAFALAVAASPAFAADEVKLLKVESTHTSYRNSYHSGRFEALVANLGYVKEVVVRLKKLDGSWADVPLTFNRNGSTGKEVWSLDFANTLPATSDPMEFALRYKVNGQEYWDNNNGQNYRIARDGGTILGSGMNVYADHQQEYHTSVGSAFGGSVTVRNIAPAKSVKIHYSTNGWQTKHVVDATFNPYFWNSGYSSVNNPNAYGFEEWGFSIPNNNNATTVEYAVQYTVNGQQYWDNNFGRNYKTNVIYH